MSNREHPGILYRQPIQLLLGLVVIVVSYLVAIQAALESTFWGISLLYWFWMAIILPLVHQLTIAPLWRLELLNKSLTQFFGSTDIAFNVFKLVFAIFFIPRMLITIPLALGTSDSVTSDQLQLVMLLAAILLTPVVFYGMYSVKRYFGIDRAFGADHFFNEYREMDKVKQGLFKYTDNAMYTFVIAFILLPGLFLGSWIALYAGIANQCLVWVHYYTTEKPDLEYIYD